MQAAESSWATEYDGTRIFGENSLSNLSRPRGASEQSNETGMLKFKECSCEEDKQKARRIDETRERNIVSAKYEQDIRIKDEIIKRQKEKLNIQAKQLQEQQMRQTWAEEFSIFLKKVEKIKQDRNSNKKFSSAIVISLIEQHLSLTNRHQVFINNCEKNLNEEHQQSAMLQHMLQEIKAISIEAKKEIAKLPKPKHGIQQKASTWKRWDTTSLYSNRFSLTQTTVEMKQNGKFYQVVSLPLPRENINFAIQFVYGCDTGILVGFITKGMLGEEWSDGNYYPQTLSYCSSPYNSGRIGMDKKTIEEWSCDLFVKEGDRLLVAVAYDFQIVTFRSTTSNRKCMVRLANSLAGKQLFLVASMSSKNDSVILL